MAQGQLRDAIGALTEATQLAPQQVDAYVGLARALWQQGELFKALVVQTALRLAPNDSTVRGPAASYRDAKAWGQEPDGCHHMADDRSYRAITYSPSIF